MSNKLTSAAQLRQAALASQGLTAEVAGAAAEAVAEVAAGLPVRRLVPLRAAEWAGSGPYTQTVSVAGVRSDEAGQLVMPAPLKSCWTAFHEAGLRCTGQGNGTLTFEAQEKPEKDFIAYVILQEVGT